MHKFLFKTFGVLFLLCQVNVLIAAEIKFHFKLAFADSCTLIIDKYFLSAYEPTYTKSIIENQCVFNLKIDNRVTATFHYNNQTMPLIVSPNSEIEVFVGADGLYNSVKMHENEMHNNQFLLNFNKQFRNEFSDSLIFETMLGSTADAFEMKSFKLQQNQMDFIRNSIDSFKPDEATVSYLKQRVKYLYYYKMQAFAIINANADKGLTVKPMPDMLLENVGPNLLNDELIGIDTYRKFIEYYVIYQTSKLNGFNKFTDFNISMDKKIAFANTRLTPRTKSYYVANYLNNHINEVLPATAKYNYQQLINNDVFGYAALVETVCKNQINAKVEKTQTVVSDYRDQKIMGVDGKYFTLQDFKGKVVYVDFWASWCGPCKQQFPYAKELHKRFNSKQQKQLIFLYVSIDKTTELWKSAIEQNGLDGFLNGLAPGDWNSDMVRYYKISSIPRYMMIDKKGDIRYIDAKRPSDNSAYDTLIELLAE